MCRREELQEGGEKKKNLRIPISQRWRPRRTFYLVYIPFLINGEQKEKKIGDGENECQFSSFSAATTAKKKKQYSFCKKGWNFTNVLFFIHSAEATQK